MSDAPALAQLILRSAKDFAFVTTDTHGRIISWSPGAERILGWTADEAIGGHIELIFTPEDRAAGRPEIEMACAAADGCATDERWHMRKDETRFWASGELQPLRLGLKKDEGIVGFVKILRDRTEHRLLSEQTEEARLNAAAARAELKEEGERLRELFEAAPGLIAVFRGREHVYEMVNQSYQQFIAPRDLIGKTIREALPEIEGQGYFELFDRVFSSGERIAGNAMPVVMAGDGEGERQPRYVDFVLEPLRDSEGVVNGVFLEGLEVTESVTARAEAERSAAFQTAVLKQLGEGVIVADDKGRIQFVNEAATKLHGVSKLDVAPEHYSDTYHLLTERGEPYPPEQLPLARAVLEGETVRDERWRIRRPDGSEVLAIGNAQPVLSGGVQVGAVLTVRDDTARRNAEDALSQSRAYLKLLLDSTEEAFYATDREGVTTLCNAAFVRMLGFDSEDEAVGRKLHEVIHHSHLDGSPYAVSDCPIYHCAANGIAAHVTDEVFFRLDGTAFPVEYRASPIVQAGENCGAICTFVDITQRRAAERALAESEQRFRRIADSTPVSMWVSGTDRKRVFVNQAYVDFLGMSYEQAIDFDWRQVVHPDDAERIAAESIAGEASGAPFVLEGRYRRADGEYRWLRSILQPRFGGGGYLTGFIGVAHDVSQAKEAETALRELNQTLETRIDRALAERAEVEEQLRQSQKMEAVGQLTGGIAHDFNNLLTIVSGNIDMARRSLGANADGRTLRAIGNAIKGADRAAALTQRLLAFSRRQPLQPRATDINRLLAGMTELLDRALGETIDLQMVAGAGLWRVEVDPNQLENAILNLAVNARDAMPEGGKLTIETSNAHIDETYVPAQREVATGPYVLVCVSDTGVGMSAEVMAKAFDPFYSTKEVGKGTGLGLSQVYGYVKQSGGHVKIYSEPGEGTSVKIYFPRLNAEMNPAEDDEPEVVAAITGQETILVVEDDDDVRMYTVETLRELGYRVLEAHDGPSALRLLDRQEESVRLLLTDVVMPAMSGRELADRARSAYPEMQVLYMTGYARNAIVHGGRLDPGVELLTKPFTQDSLAAKIREVIDKGEAERALLVDPRDEDRSKRRETIAALGYAVEVAATAREALGKLRAANGRFDFVVVSDALPVGNLGAVVAELHTVRKDLPVLIVCSKDKRGLADEFGANRRVGVIDDRAGSPAIRDWLASVRLSGPIEQSTR